MRIKKHHLLFGVSFGCVIALTASARAQSTAPNQWTWVGGSNIVTDANGQPGVYGKLKTPAGSNIPGARDSAATWTDSNGNFWLFGGEGVDANDAYGLLNDLWELNPSTNVWTWMGGSSTLPASCVSNTTTACGAPGVYGVQGAPSPGNMPGARWGASYWTDSKGNFWLFGGAGFDADQNSGELNDLWMFSPATGSWAWIAGSTTVGTNGGQSGDFGTLGVPAAANVPSGRDSAQSWIDKNGSLWLYGGEGFDGQGNAGDLDDLWQFNTSTNQWVWMGGNGTIPAVCASGITNDGHCGWPAAYGALGVSAPNNTPGSRVASASWADNDGNFWLFGGLGILYWSNFEFSPVDQYDLWKFNPSTSQWTWMGGNTTMICGQSSSTAWCDQDGVYGTLGVPAIGNIPASRSNLTSWIDGTGIFWLFGGLQAATTNIYGPSVCNDTWEFNPTANEWGWMNGSSQEIVFGGDCSIASAGSWGVLGTPASTNIPSGRLGSAGWVDKDGNFWIFGGYGIINNGVGFSDLNDLWVYQPVSPAPTPSFELIASPNPITIAAIGSATSTTIGTTNINVVAADRFDSPLTLSVASDTMNGVTDITGSLSPTTITGGGSTLLTVSVIGSAVMVSEPIPLVITATSGDISQSVQVIVVVTPAVQISAPTFSLAPGTYTGSQTVTISDTGELPIIYYTTDGTIPSLNSPVYVNPVTLTSTTTLKAIATSFAIGASDITTATYTINPPAPDFSVSGTAVTVAPGATTGNTSTISLTPADGFSGNISLSCAITPIAASDPATCSIPSSVSISGLKPQVTTLTVHTTAATSDLASSGKSYWVPVTGADFAGILLIGITTRRQRFQRMLLPLLLFSWISFGLSACGGGGNGGRGGAGGETGNQGTTAGNYTITVTGTSGATTHTAAVSLTVQ